MKKCIVLLALFMFSNISFAEEIKLDVNTSLEQNINLETPNQTVFESSPQKLENKGFVLQNSITPVHGLKYNSQVIIPDAPVKPEEKATMPDSDNEQAEINSGNQ